MPKLPGQEGIDNISGIAWDDINKINAIEKNNIENISGVLGGDDFIWGQQDGVYLFTSFQNEPDSDWTANAKRAPGETTSDYGTATPTYGNYPVDTETAEVGNTLDHLGKINGNGTTGWLNGEDQFYRPDPTELETGDHSLAYSHTNLNHHNGVYTDPPNGPYKERPDSWGGDVSHDQWGYHYMQDIGTTIGANLGILTERNLLGVHATSNGWIMGDWGKTSSGDTGLPSGGSGLTHEQTGSWYGVDNKDQNGGSLSTSEQKERRYAYIESSYDGAYQIYTLRTPLIDFRSGSATTDNQLEFYIMSHINFGDVDATTEQSYKHFSFQVQATTGDDPYFLNESNVKVLEATYSTRSMVNGGDLTNPTEAVYDSTLKELSGSVQGLYTNPWVKVTLPLNSTTNCFTRAAEDQNGSGSFHNAGTLFNEDFYLRFFVTSQEYRSDVCIDNVKIYGTPS